MPTFRATALVVIVAFIAAQFHLPTGASGDVVTIDVNTGDVVDHEADGNQPPEFTSWPTDQLDLAGVKVVLADGEDVPSTDDPVDLIVRAFQRLPMEDQDRIGFTSIYHDGMSPEEVNEAELRRLWEQRQVELKEAMDAMQDVRNVLEGYIDVLRNMNAPVEDVLSALDELGDLLSDVDMARDFHDSFGGWQPLLRRMGDDQPDELRAAATLVVGTTMQNQREFQMYAAESAGSVELSSLQHNETVVASLITMLRDEAGLVRRRAMFALSAAVRHNAENQAIFIELDGAATVFSALRSTCDGDTRDTNLISKLAAFITDMLAEEGQHGTDGSSQSRRLYQELRSPPFRTQVGECLLPEHPARVHEKLLKTIMSQRVGSSAQPAGPSERRSTAAAVEALSRAYCGESSASEMDMDPEYRTEMCQLVQKALSINGAR